MTIPLHLAHGTRYRYVKGCRCDLCRESNARYSIRQRWAKRGINVEWPPGNHDIVTPRKRKESP